MIIIIFALGLLTVNAEAKRSSNPFSKINSKERYKYLKNQKRELENYADNSSKSGFKQLFYKIGSSIRGSNQTNDQVKETSSNFQSESQTNFRNNFYNSNSFSTKHEHQRKEVQNFVKKFNQSKKTLIKHAHVAKPHLQYVASQVQQRNLPRELAMVPMIESNFKQKATSNKGAAGIWQIMPATGRRFGLKTGKGYDGRRDVKASTKAALNYLEYLNRRYKGDWMLSLAAYNAGEGRVDNAIKKNKKAGKPTTFWHLKLPAQTRAYVPKIMAMSQVIDPQ